MLWYQVTWTSLMPYHSMNTLVAEHAQLDEPAQQLLAAAR